MSIPTSEPISPEDDEQLHPVKSRRPRSRPSAGYSEEPGNLRPLLFLYTPSIDYYFGFLLAGLLTGAAVLLEAPALYILAVLFTPFLGPVYGLYLAAAAGSVLKFMRFLFHLAAGVGLVFALGALTGWIGTNLPSVVIPDLIRGYTRQSWPDYLTLAVGAGLSAYLSARSPRQKPLVANVAVAYELIMPLLASGAMLTAGSHADWIGSLYIFLVRLSATVLVSAAVFALVGYKPASLSGSTLALLMILSAVGAVWLGASLQPAAQTAVEPTPAPSATATLSSAPAAMVTSTPQPEGAATPTVQPTSTPTETLFPTMTPTATITLAPTPVWAKIDAPSGGGAFIRAEPGGKILTSLLNGSPVEVVSEPVRVEGGAIWVQVRTENGVVGWILQSLLATATPSPGW